MVLLPEQGRLEEMAFPNLLVALHRARFSGMVRLSRDRVEKSFLFREGVPVFAESNLDRERLGARLMESGEISRSDCERVARQVEQEGCKEGKAILDLEIVEPRELFRALKQQVRATLIECFGWARGKFTIEPGDAPNEETQPFRTDLFSLLQEGIETRWDTDRILADLAPRMNRLAKAGALASPLLSRLGSDEAAAAFVGALDGTRTLWKALQSAKTPRALTLAWLLNAFEAIDYADAGASGSEASGDAAPEDEAPELEIVFGEAEPEAPREDPGRGAEEAAEGPSAVRTVRAGDPAADALHRDIAEKFSRLADLDHYELLDVDAKADVATIKNAYLKAAKYYHPDALARLRIEGEVRQQASKVFAEIGRAYAVLSNPERRRHYDSSRAGEGEIDAEKVAAAETFFRKGEILLRLGNFRGAVEFLQPAVELYPEEADYQNALGWALYKKHPSEPERAKTHLQRAIELSPKDAALFFRLGVILRSLGESAAAAEMLARARRIDPEIS